MSHCGRSSGRSRIGTTNCWVSISPSQLRSLFGAIEDWNSCPFIDKIRGRIAVALRGDRGLEPNTGNAPIVDLTIAVALRGDRGLELACEVGILGFVRLRSLFGAIEDWNLTCLCLCLCLRLRSLFGAIEDWNASSPAPKTVATGIAVALRGDRGLELTLAHLRRNP